MLIVLHALGQCLIRTAVTSITPRADMCFALASYLTRERGTRVPRRTVERLFWPTIRSGEASHSLSELIHKLRGKGVLIERDEASCIWLPRHAAAVDVESIADIPAAQLAARDLSILPGYSPRASGAFSDWVDEWRENMRMQVLSNVVTATSAASGSRDWTLTLALAQQALRIDPANEAARIARARAAAHLAQGDQLIAGSGHPDDRSLRVTTRLREAAAPARWRSAATDARSPEDTTLVGRELPMRQLTERALGALHGQVCAAYVSAPAGLGKSRIAREIATWMRKNGGAICTVACERHDGQRPLSAFIDAVPRLQALPGAAGCAPSTVACLARITRLTSESSDITARDDPNRVSASIRASIIDLIDAVADEQPLLFVVEDVHWIDRVSWSLLRSLIAKAHRSMFLLCTSRSPWQYSEWGSPEDFHLEALPPLDHAATRSHMQDYLARHSRSAEEKYITWCVETSTGNPYFLEELVNYWMSTGEQYSAPPSLVALVEARIAHLRPEALRVIQAAAILGRNSTIELLRKVLELPTHLLFSAIEELHEAGLLTTFSESQAASPHGSAPVLCKHDLIGRAATRSLSAEGRALLHHASAGAIELSTRGAQSAELLWECADHWLAAGQNERALGAAVACAQHLSDMGLPHDAVTRCNAALAIAITDPDRATVLRAKARAQFLAHDWNAFCETVGGVRALENPLGTDLTSGVASHDDLELCELHARRNLHRDWQRSLDDALRCTRATNADKRHRVKASVTALKLATNLGALHTMDAVYRSASSILEMDEISLTDRLTVDMVYHTIRGSPEIGATAARELIRITQCSLPKHHQLGVLIDCAGALRRGGLHGEAESVYAALFHTSNSLRCFDVAAEACHRLIEMHCDSGQTDCAMTWVNEYRALHRPKREFKTQRNLRLAIARVHICREEWEEAAALLETPKSNLPSNDPVPMFRSGALALKIRLDIGRGRSREAVEASVKRLVPLSELLRPTGAQDYETHSLYLGYRYIGETRAAEAMLLNYIVHERRDRSDLSPEIATERDRLSPTPGRPA